MNDHLPMVSVLLPTRKRVAFLKRCIQSLVDTASKPDNFEVILRIHRDDSETIEALPELLSMAAVRVVIGMQYRGYDDLARFYEEAVAISNGTWVWVMNDDIVVESSFWDEIVLGIRHRQKVIVMPAENRLNESVYTNDMDCPFMFLPNKCWEESLKKRGRTRFRNPFDRAIWTMLREDGFRTEFVPVSIWHDHRTGEERDKDRIGQVSPNFHSDSHELFTSRLPEPFSVSKDDYPFDDV